MFFYINMANPVLLLPPQYPLLFRFFFLAMGDISTIYRGGYPEEDAPYNRNITRTYTIAANGNIAEMKAGSYL